MKAKSLHGVTAGGKRAMVKARSDEDQPSSAFECLMEV